MTASSNNVSWHSAIRDDPRWQWRRGKLWHIDAATGTAGAKRVAGLQRIFVGAVYADQNRSTNVRLAIRDLLASLGPQSVAVNVGAGNTRFSNVANLEIGDGPTIDIINVGAELPFKDCSVDLVIAQEVLEHVAEFKVLIDEVRRVLKPGGRFFCQVPFQIGFHPGPYDYWRFTRQGIEHLFGPPFWRRQQLAISLGHGSGFYRIAVEFIAVTVACVSSRVYKPAKAAAALALYPIKMCDALTRFSPEADRIPGGYFCIAQKVS